MKKALLLFASVLMFAATSRAATHDVNASVNLVGAFNVTSTNGYHFVNTTTTLTGCNGVTLYFNREDTDLYNTLLTAYLTGKSVYLYYDDATSVTIAGYTGTYNCHVLRAAIHN